MPPIQVTPDAHSRVVILFKVPAIEKTEETEAKPEYMVKISVIWLLTYGVPTDPETGEQMKYVGTHIIQ